ncbi:hypothetical protein B0H16DRAFT_1722248 [Mycena metata]|uniref:MARVEL domain-containing protein n=1 Tax=Mycena metata TaxID=1033252 RepID=A0AAD7NDC5_9AGAR|nr:hypothetical protein B0H16DRAFT_1722248 [Mycena metata]
MAPAPSDPDQASNLTSGLTSILACIIPLLALIYIGSVLWTLDYTNRRRNPLNKAISLASHHYAPIAYAFVVITSLVVIAIPSWILLQYNLQHNYPNTKTEIGMRLVLFTACWTSVTAATFTILFVHPTWSRHPITSVGTQSIWVLFTWAFWVASATTLNAALPRLFDKQTCQHLVYCGHIRAIFAFSVLEIAVFTMGMAAMMWFAWRCARDVWAPSATRGQSV